MAAEPYVAPVRRRFGSNAITRERPRGQTHWLDRAAVTAMLLLTMLCLIVPLIAPHTSTEQVGLPLTAPNRNVWFGTDEVGHDVFSRVLFGLRTSWLSAFAVVASGVVIGGLIGLVAGASGGWVDSLLMRTTDAFLALPGPVLAIAVVAALGPSLPHTLFAIGLVWWPFYARIVRGEIHALAARPHLEAARMAGASRYRLAVRHLMPGAISPALVAASLDIGNLVLTLAGLSFLGLGAPAPAPELGAMAARGLSYLLQDWWVPVIPGIAVMALSLIANLAGDGLRDLVGRR